MTFVFTEEQIMIQTMARNFSRDVVLPGAAERDRTCNFPKNVLREMGKLGFMGMMVPEVYGGLGGETISYVLALIEIAYACASTAVVMSLHNSICCESLLYFGTEEQKRYWLPALCSGECLGAFALTEPQAGSDPSNQLTTAIKDNDAWVINGIKQFITSGKNAGLIIVTAVTDKNKRRNGISAFLVPQGTPGLLIGKNEDKLGLKASDTVQLIFEDCRISKKNLLGQYGEGFRLAMAGLASGRIGIAAQSVGVAQACLDESISFVNARKQFGYLLSDFQGLRWRLAEMATEIEAARLLSLNAALLKNLGQDYSMQASMAKMFASEMVNQIAAKALQMHGGYGYCSDYPIERHYRDARVFTIYEGTSEIQRMIISNKLLGHTRLDERNKK